MSSIFSKFRRRYILWIFITFASTFLSLAIYLFVLTLISSNGKFHVNKVNAVFFSRDGNFLATESVKPQSYESQIEVFTSSNHALVQTFMPPNSGSRLHLIGWNSQGKLILWRLVNEGIEFWSVRDKKTVFTIKIDLSKENMSSWFVVANADTTMLALTNFTVNTIQLYHVIDNSVVKSWSIQSPIYTSTAFLFSGDGQYVIGATDSRTVTFWRSTDGVKIKQLTVINTGLLHSIAVSSDGQRLAAGTDNGAVFIWHLNDNTLLRVANIGNNLSMGELIFSPNGQLLATSVKTLSGYGFSYEALEKDISIVKLNDGYVVEKLIGHEKGITGLAFSPDGLTLASASQDDTIRFWSLP